MTSELERRAEFFKALAHPSRILIVNLCRKKARHTEELASILRVTPATVSHHLKLLEACGVLESHKNGYYQDYAPSQNVLEQRVLDLLDLPLEANPKEGEDSFPAKVLRDFFKNGRLKEIPAQRKKRDIVLEKIVQGFEFDRQYPEAEANAILSEYHADFATLRRELIGLGLLARERNVYWRLRSE